MCFSYLLSNLLQYDFWGVSKKESGKFSTSQSPKAQYFAPCFFFSVFNDDPADQCEIDPFLYADDSTCFCEIGSVGDADMANASLNRDLESMKI